MESKLKSIQFLINLTSFLVPIKNSLVTVATSMVTVFTTASCNTNPLLECWCRIYPDMKLKKIFFILKIILFIVKCNLIYFNMLFVETDFVAC